MPGEWVENLSGEVKTADELKDIDSVQSLAEKFIKISRDRVSPLGESETLDGFLKKTGDFFNIKGVDQYPETSPEKLKQSAFELKIHPKQFTGFMEKVREMEKATGLANLEEKVAKYKKEAESLSSELGHIDVKRAEGARKLGVTLDSLKDKLGSEYHNPMVQKMLVMLGGDKMTDTYQKTGTPTTSGSGSPEKGAEEISAQKKVQYIYDMRSNTKSAYWDKTSKEHQESRQKVAKYVEDLKEYQKKTGEKVYLEPQD